MNNDQHDFEQFIEQRRNAASAYINGNADLLGEIVTHNAPATFFKPSGEYYQGPEEVWTRYKEDAKNFDSGSEGKLEILQMAASDGLAYWVGFQRASARLKGKPEPIPFDLRVTELFRREGDNWKLIHRHVDPVKAENEAK